MASSSRGLLQRLVQETPVAVIDFETTGLSAGYDRVVEVSVVRIDPGKPPQLIVDTLVNPDRPVRATEIHGITDEDVADAPRFEEIGSNVAMGLRGAIVASYNIYFDVKFLTYELSRIGIRHVPPHLCLMYLRPMLGLGKRCSLDAACREHRIDLQSSHQASFDAMAAASLWSLYAKEIASRGLRTFDELRQLKSYKFAESFEFEPLDDSSIGRRAPAARFKPRLASIAQIVAATADPRKSARREYWEVLKTILSDLEVSDAELQEITDLRSRLDLEIGEIRSLHARAYAGVIYQVTEDRVLDDHECKILRRLHRCLSRLGWAPGEH